MSSLSISSSFCMRLYLVSASSLLFWLMDGLNSSVVFFWYSYSNNCSMSLLVSCRLLSRYRWSWTVMRLNRVSLCVYPTLLSIYLCMFLTMAAVFIFALCGVSLLSVCLECSSWMRLWEWEGRVLTSSRLCFWSSLKLLKCTDTFYLLCLLLDRVLALYLAEVALMLLPSLTLIFENWLLDRSMCSIWLIFCSILSCWDVVL